MNYTPTPNQPVASVPPEPQVPKKPHGCLTAFVGFMLAVSLICAITLVNLRLTVFSPGFWKDWLAESDAYERIEEVLLPNLFSSMALTTPTEQTEMMMSEDAEGYYDVSVSDETTEVSSEYEDSLSEESIEAIDQLLQDSITAAWLEEQSETAIDSFFRWVHGQDEELRIVFDLTPLQGAFATGMIDILEIEYENLPPCTDDFSDVDPEELEGMQCRYEGIDFEEVRAEFAKQNPEEIGFGNIPSEYVIDEVAFTSLVSGEDSNMTQDIPGSESVLENPPHLYQTFGVAMWIAIILTAVFAAIMILLYRRDRAAMSKALGITLLIPMAVIFAIDLAIFLGARTMTGRLLPVTNQATTESMAVPAEVISAQTEIFSEFALPILAEFLQKMLVYQIIISGVMMAGAIFLLVLASILKKRQLVAYYNNTNPPA